MMGPVSNVLWLDTQGRQYEGKVGSRVPETRLQLGKWNGNFERV